MKEREDLPVLRIDPQQTAECPRDCHHGEFIRPQKPLIWCLRHLAHDHTSNISARITTWKNSAFFVNFKLSSSKRCRYCSPPFWVGMAHRCTSFGQCVVAVLADS